MKTLRAQFEKDEFRLIIYALEQCRWNHKKAAEMLGISYSNLISRKHKLKYLDVPKVHDGR